MSHTIEFPVSQNVFTSEHSTTGIYSRFINFCASQEQKRLMWSGIILTIQASVITPLSLVVSMLAGIHFLFFIPIIAALIITYVTNLAALSTRYTIPVFVLSIFMNLIVIIGAMFTGFNPELLFGS